MVKFNAGTLFSSDLNSISLASSSNKEYSKFKRLCKSGVSNPKAKCFAAIGYFESVNEAFVQCDVFLISFQPSISERYTAPIP